MASAISYHTSLKVGSSFLDHAHLGGLAQPITTCGLRGKQRRGGLPKFETTSSAGSGLRFVAFSPNGNLRPYNGCHHLVLLPDSTQSRAAGRVGPSARISWRRLAATGHVRGKSLASGTVCCAAFCEVAAAKTLLVGLAGSRHPIASDPARPEHELRDSFCRQLHYATGACLVSCNRRLTTGSRR